MKLFGAYWKSTILYIEISSSIWQMLPMIGTYDRKYFIRDKNDQANHSETQKGRVELKRGEERKDWSVQV